ncbi:SCO family protein [Foetidibacter luteolus]|uniref:SCO family protein n=1 Tax=Foetidibacter luteolus TaxID=2608880 RepID=UPI00129BA140|nr:SCO family protein [Foetidibacter luteolus]
MNKKLVGYSLFFVVLTGLFLVFVFAGTDNWKKKSPAISVVKPFSFFSQNGTRFTDKDMEGKVCVVEFFFTTCKGICPKLNTNMKDIYQEFKNEPDFMILSHTSDPETDSVPVLKRYADSIGANSNNWVFLTGRKDSLYLAARNSYLLDDPKNNLVDINQQFLHTQFFAVVDKEGKVRGGVYDGLKKDEIAKLKSDVKTLLAEKQGHNGFANGIFNNNP